jgi:hypothetical protein
MPRKFVLDCLWKWVVWSESSGKVCYFLVFSLSESFRVRYCIEGCVCE